MSSNLEQNFTVKNVRSVPEKKKMKKATHGFIQEPFFIRFLRLLKAKASEEAQGQI